MEHETISAELESKPDQNVIMTELKPFQHLVGRFVLSNTDNFFVEYVSLSQKYVIAHGLGKRSGVVILTSEIEAATEDCPDTAIQRLFRFQHKIIVYTDRLLQLTCFNDETVCTAAVEEIVIDPITLDIRTVAVDNACYLYQILGKAHTISVLNGVQLDHIKSRPDFFVSALKEYLKTDQHIEAKPLSDLHPMDLFAESTGVTFAELDFPIVLDQN